jgi:hypothetical protein
MDKLQEESNKPDAKLWMIIKMDDNLDYLVRYDLYLVWSFNIMAEKIMVLI